MAWLGGCWGEGGREGRHASRGMMRASGREVVIVGDAGMPAAGHDRRGVQQGRDGGDSGERGRGGGDEGMSLPRVPGEILRLFMPEFILCR